MIVHRSYTHNLSSYQNKAWKNIQVWTGIRILHLLWIYYELCDQFPVSLIAQLVGALQRFRRGYVFESRSSLNFSGFNFTTF